MASVVAFLLEVEWCCIYRIDIVSLSCVAQRYIGVKRVIKDLRWPMAHSEIYGMPDRVITLIYVLKIGRRKMAAATS